MYFVMLKVWPPKSHTIFNTFKLVHAKIFTYFHKIKLVSILLTSNGQKLEVYKCYYLPKMKDKLFTAYMRKTMFYCNFKNIWMIEVEIESKNK